MKSLADELSKVSKKMSEYQAEINRLNKSLASQKRKLAVVAAGKDSAATATEDAPKKLKVAKERRVGERVCRDMTSGQRCLRKHSTQV